MKMHISKSMLVFLLLPAAFLCSFVTIADKANFSGNWKLNESKSELGEFGGRGVALSFKIEQKDNAITISRTTPGFGGGDPMTTVVTLTYDGKVVESEGFGGSVRKWTAKWSDDQTLTITSSMVFDRDGQTMEIKGTEVWTITKDGLLSVVNTSSSPRGDYTTKAIYEK